MFFLARLDSLLQSVNQSELLSWRQDFSTWVNQTLERLPTEVVATIDCQWLQELDCTEPKKLAALRSMVLALEDSLWSELGPTKHPASNRLAHCVGAAQEPAQVLERELRWGRCYQNCHPLVQVRPDPSETDGAELRALRAELSAFQESFLGLLQLLVRDLSRPEAEGRFSLDELLGLGQVYASIDLQGFCRGFSSGPTQLGLLNCFLHAAWQVHQSQLSDRVFSVLKEELVDFLQQLQQQQELLLEMVPRSRGLSISLNRSLESLPELGHQVDLLESSDLGSAKKVEAASGKILEAYRSWNLARQELLIVSGSQDEDLWLSGLWQDCQAVFYEGLDVQFLRSKTARILATAGALGDLVCSLGGLCSDKSLILPASGWCDKLRRRLDFVELFADQPNQETLLLVRQELMAQLDDLEDLDL